MPEVFMPRLSDTMEEGELTTWRKKVGDEIHKGDVLAEIETDKATMDLESFEEGTLTKLLVEEGTLVPIGQPVAVIGDDNAAATDLPTTTQPAAAPEHAPSPEPGEPEPAAAGSSHGETVTAAPVTGRLLTSPLARKVAREHDIELATITGSGPQGRIVRADVETAIAAAQGPDHGPAHAPSTQASTAPGPAAAPEAPADTGTETGGTETDVEKVALSKIRRVTARRLAESQAVPHFFLTSIVDAEALVSFRTEINTHLAATGSKVSLNDLIVRAAALTLREHPDVNSSWNDDALLRHRRINIGIAVALDDGLIVPVIADADRKTLTGIAAEAVALATRARAGKLTLGEFSGGTFTVSNLGMFGIDQFTAVINPPEAAILAVGATTPEPAVRDGELVTVRRMKITLTADHRVLDGASAAAFLRDLTRILEDPLRIVL